MTSSEDPLDRLEQFANGEFISEDGPLLREDHTPPAWVLDPHSRDITEGQVLLVIHLDVGRTNMQMWTNFYDHDATIGILEEAASHARKTRDRMTE